MIEDTHIHSKKTVLNQMMNRPTTAEIHADALRHNIQTIRRASGHGKVIAVIKANAYGHGSEHCAHIFAREGASMLAVAVLDEALSWRFLPEVERVAVLVVTPPFAHEADAYCDCSSRTPETAPCAFSAASVETVRAFSSAAKARGVTLSAHLYVDTGMRRDGIEPEDALAFMRVCAEFDGVRFDGICTHFASADDADKTFATKQLQRFQDTICTLGDAGWHFPMIHAANSAATADMPESLFNTVRAGIALYGCQPSHEMHTKLDLRPALTLKTRVVSLRRVPPATPVSYSGRYTTPAETTIATLPIGYGDGFPRGLSGKASCLIHGERFPIVGTICMDQCMVDVGNAPVSVGDEVVLLGEQGNSRIFADELAEALGTIPYEVLTNISARVRRVLVA